MEDLVNMTRDLALEYRLLRYLTETDEMAERMRNFDRDGRDRYRDIRPFNDNIVHGVGGVYVNASFVHSPSQNNTYIVSQAPTMKAIPEWLGMLAKHGVEYVFCLTVCDAKHKQCSRYWPETVNRPERFPASASSSSSSSSCRVTLQREEQMYGGSVVRRSLTVEFGEDGERNEFQFKQMQFTQWPDHGVPELAALLPVVNALEEARKESSGRPVAVHCSAGVGRAGTLVAIANCLEKARTTGRISVLEECVKMRQQRPYLVQTTAQYELIYEALRHVLFSSGKKSSYTLFCSLVEVAVS